MASFLSTILAGFGRRLRQIASGIGPKIDNPGWLCAPTSAAGQRKGSAERLPERLPNELPKELLATTFWQLPNERK